MTDLDVLHQLNHCLIEARPVVMATIVSTSGSSPRAVGAKMLILSETNLIGTIGGGKFEAQVIKDSLELLNSSGRHLLKKYRFSSHGEGALGMSCGGEAEVFLEAFQEPDRLFIFGGGHIGRALANQACGSGFAVTVIDDRPEILDGFNKSVQLIQADKGYTGNYPEVDKNSFIVILTSSQSTDQLILKNYITKKTAYIGAMGSKAKIAKTFTWLTEQGVSQEDLNKVHSPIGLDIKAEGPYEIAVSIMAQLIEQRNLN